MSHEQDSPSIPGELEDTDSYDLAQVESEESGPIQPVNNGNRLFSTQWKPSSRTVEESLAAGLSNEDLWLLIRRFNKQIYYVKALPDTAGQEIDLNRADGEQYPPEKLRMTVERFYTSVIVGFTEFFRHVARLRSWKEPGRTAVFCSVYFIAWLSDRLIPTLLGVIVLLILCPPIRPFIFPAATAKPDSDTGDAKKSTNGIPDFHDSVTGAPEKHKGEAAEQEAANLVNSVANVAMESAAGKYGQGVAEDAPEEPDRPDTALLEIAADAQTENTAADKTKKPMKKKVSRATDQTMRVLSDITDIYEKFANLLSPTPPFLLIMPRLRLAGIFLTICLLSPFASSYWIIKMNGFIIGLCFFGDPIIKNGVALLNSKIPDWTGYLDLQKTLLKGVPTNAQLTLTLLRIGEINSSPLPPPPSSQDNGPEWPIPRKKSKALISDQSNNQEATVDLQRQQSNETLPGTKSKRRWVFKVIKFVRRTIATAIKGHIAFDRAIAIAGSSHTKNLIGMLQDRHWKTSEPFGPLKFDAKFERKRGAVVIDASKEPPILYFTTYQSAGLDDLRIESRKKGSVLFQVPVTDIQELKKTEGLGWKGKLIVELTAGSKEAADGLVVVGKEEGQLFHLTGMRARNQLFNRLVAIDAQFWESH